MLVGRTLYLLGMAFVFFSVVVIIMAPFSNGVGDLAFPMFALLNGFIAMGVGDIVIDLNYRKKVEKMNKE